MSNSKQTPELPLQNQPTAETPTTKEVSQPKILPNINGNVRTALLQAYQKAVNLIGEKQASAELSFASQIIAKNPALQKCQMTSIIDSVVNASRVNITLNPALRLAYLIPRRDIAVLEISYMGYITILKRGGGVKYIDAFIVYADEDFRFEPTTGKLYHTPTFALTEQEQKSRKIIGCYSRATLPSNDVVFNYMPIWEINKIRGFSQNKDEKWSTWNMWEEEMIKKTAIKRHFKLLISDSTNEYLHEAIRIEEENNPMNFAPQKSSLLDFDFDSPETI